MTKQTKEDDLLLAELEILMQFTAGQLNRIKDYHLPEFKSYEIEKNTLADGRKGVEIKIRFIFNDPLMSGILFDQK